MKLLNFRRERFARRVAAGMSHRQSAIEAGFSPRSASALGSQLVKFHSVSERIRELRHSRQKAAAHSSRIKAEMHVSDAIEPTLCFDSAGQAVGVFVPIAPEQKKS
jgi:hypothetical protein